MYTLFVYVRKQVIQRLLQGSRVTPVMELQRFGFGGKDVRHGMELPRPRASLSMRYGNCTRFLFKRLKNNNTVTAR
jgi:hypothetical protein